jgi:hypothetical protein
VIHKSALGKFSQLREQAKENILATQNNLAGAAFHNCEKLLTPVNFTQVLADELKTSTNTASRIIQIQANDKKPQVFTHGFNFGGTTGG